MKKYFKEKLLLLVAACALVASVFIPTSLPSAEDASVGKGTNVVLMNDALEQDTETNEVTALSDTSTVSGEWFLSNDTNIFWVKTNDSTKENAALVKQIQLFDSELAAKVTGTVLPIVYGTLDQANENDIVLILDSTLSIPEQGYTISLTGNKLMVSASDSDGLFYGCRYVMEALLLNGNVTSITDNPDVNERALSLDIGRKYYTVEWIKNLIKEMSWAKMNALVLHFSEEMGVGIESKTYPWLAGRDGSLCVPAEIATDNRYITQNELREIAEVAKLYHVELIPSFDSPGHLNYAVKKYNEQYNTDIGNYYHYNNKTLLVQGSRNKSYSRGIDISNTEATTFVKNLITEYANLFKELGCTKFDIGGDELLGWGNVISSSVSRWQQLDHWKEYAINRTGNSKAVAYDGFMLYMNDLYDLVTNLGYTSVRMWNDDALRSNDTGWNKVVTLNKNVEILYWTASANNGKNNVKTYINEGYKVHNYLCYYNYYVLGVTNTDFEGTYAESIYNNWNAYVFDPDSSVLGSTNNTVYGDSNVLGAAFLIWCDNPSAETEETVMTNIRPMIRANGAKSWCAYKNNDIPFATFTANNERIGNVPTSLPTPSKIGLVIDTTELESLINEFYTLDSSLYTAESFKVYENTINVAKDLISTDTYTKELVEKATNKIKTAKSELIEAEKVNNTLVISNAVFKSSKVTRGRIATLVVTVSDNAKAFEIYDDLGDLVNITSTTVSPTGTGEEGTVYYTFKFKAGQKGLRTYSIYAIDENGNLSTEPYVVTLTVV